MFFFCCRHMLCHWEEKSLVDVSHSTICWKSTGKRKKFSSNKKLNKKRLSRQRPRRKLNKASIPPWFLPAAPSWPLISCAPPPSSPLTISIETRCLTLPNSHQRKLPGPHRNSTHRYRTGITCTVYLHLFAIPVCHY